MRRNIIIPLLLMAGVCLAERLSAQSESDIKKLKWLQGTWTITNTKPGQSGLEHWDELKGELRGYSVTLKGVDTIFSEKLRITRRDNNWYYVADVSENQKPVYFKLISITDKGFVCENPEHDFPKMITYQLDGNKLRATISGDGKARDFLFSRK